MPSFGLRAFLVGAAFFMAAATHAGTITGQLVGVGNNNVVQLRINDGNGTNNFFNYGYSGYVNWAQTPANNNTGIPNNFSTFCIELTQNISIGSTYTYTLATLESAPTPGSPQTGQPNGMGSFKANAIRKLWAGAYSSNMSQVDAAAFQLAVWRLEYDLDSTKTISQMTSFTSGNFRVLGNNSAGNSAVAAAQSLITKVMDGTFTNMEMDLVALTNENYQDQITVSSGPTFQEVPEPASLGLWLVSGVLLAGRCLRRKKVMSST